MKEIYTMFWNQQIKKYQQCFIFYDKENFNNFGATMEAKNKESIIYNRRDDTLILLIDYTTERGFQKGQEIIRKFGIENKIEQTTTTKKRRTGLKYELQNTKQQ